LAYGDHGHHDDGGGFEKNGSLNLMMENRLNQNLNQNRSSQILELPSRLPLLQALQLPYASSREPSQELGLGKVEQEQRPSCASLVQLALPVL
jgi:hypothetical protein